MACYHYYGIRQRYVTPCEDETTLWFRLPNRISLIHRLKLTEFRYTKLLLNLKSTSAKKSLEGM